MIKAFNNMELNNVATFCLLMHILMATSELHVILCIVDNNPV